jgi:hypothetical protein
MRHKSHDVMRFLDFLEEHYDDDERVIEFLEEREKDFESLTPEDLDSDDMSIDALAFCLQKRGLASQDVVRYEFPFVQYTCKDGAVYEMGYCQRPVIRRVKR